EELKKAAVRRKKEAELDLDRFLHEDRRNEIEKTKGPGGKQPKYPYRSVKKQKVAEANDVSTTKPKGPGGKQPKYPYKSYKSVNDVIRDHNFKKSKQSKQSIQSIQSKRVKQFNKNKRPKLESRKRLRYAR